MLLLLLTVSSVFACGPGSGPTHSTATYTYTILPPLPWTYADDTVAGAVLDPAQSSNSTDAQNQIEGDVVNCIQATLAEYNIPLSSVNTTINYKAVATVTIATKCTSPSPPAGEFVSYMGTLYYKCNPSPTQMASSAGNIILQSTTPLTEDQWHNLAVKVQNRLIAKSVNFQSNVVVTFS